MLERKNNGILSLNVKKTNFALTLENKSDITVWEFILIMRLILVRS